MKTIVTLLILISFKVSGNTIYITGNFEGLENEKYATVSLSNISNNEILQSVYLNNGNLNLKINNLTIGIYRLFYSSFNKNGSFDIIIENENVFSFSINTENENPIPIFLLSEKNKKWYNYKLEQIVKINKIDFLTKEIYKNKDNDKNHSKKLTSELEYLKIKFNESKSKFLEENSNSIITLYEKNFHSLFNNPNLTPLENHNHIKKIFFNNVSFHEILIETTLYNDLFFNYFSLCLKIDQLEFKNNLKSYIQHIPFSLLNNDEIQEIISNVLLNYFGIEQELITKVFVNNKVKI